MLLFFTTVLVLGTTLLKFEINIKMVRRVRLKVENVSNYFNCSNILA